MTIPRISTDVEKPFRDAVGHALRNEFEEMREGLLHLTDDQIASCLNMCAFAAGYVAIDVCGRQWPDKDNLFAAANVRLWDEIALAGTSDWTAKMAQAAKSWAAYRQAR